MKINGEDCELITDFAQLRASDVIYVIRCLRCGKPPHRGMLLRPGRTVVYQPNGVAFVADAFPFMPTPRCHPTQAVVVELSVRAGDVWRVVIPPAKDSTTMEDNDDAVRQSQAEPVHACGAPARRA